MGEEPVPLGYSKPTQEQVTSDNSRNDDDRDSLSIGRLNLFYEGKSVTDANRKRRRLSMDAGRAAQRPRKEQSPGPPSDALQAAASVLALDSRNVSPSTSAALTDFLNNYPINSVEPARKLQQDIFNHRAGKAHPALVYTRPRSEWSNSLEKEAAKLWEAAQEDGQLTISPCAESRYRSLWKVCLHYAACTPWDIVGERYRLRFQSLELPDTSLVFSRDFCEQLSQIVTHSIWPRPFEGALAMNIAIALQYTVILRTGDPRPWNPAPDSEDDLYKLMRKHEKKEPMPIRHDRIRQVCARWQINLSVMSDIFLALEKTVSSPGGTFEASKDGLYGVTEGDLAVVIRALDEMRTPLIGTLAYLPTLVQHSAAMDACPSHVSPSKLDLQELHDEAMFEEKRRLIIREHAGTVAAPTRPCEKHK